MSWIDAAIDLLEVNGIDAVRVDVLAKVLGVTRGSFYWHFKGRDDLLKSVLKVWREWATDQLIQRFERETNDPRIVLKELIALPFQGSKAERAARIELAIRAWARRDDMARNGVDEVDARRISYLAQCFSQLGFSIPEARLRGETLYACALGDSFLIRQGSADQKSARVDFLEKMLLHPLKTR